MNMHIFIQDKRFDSRFESSSVSILHQKVITNKSQSTNMSQKDKG